MLDYAAKLAREPWAMSQTDVGRLRDAGFSDRAILEINLAASYMSFVNRLAEGLGRQAPGAHEPFGLYALGLGSGSVHEARQAGGLFHCGKAGLFGRGWKTHQTTSFHASANIFDSPITAIAARRAGMWAGGGGLLIGLIAGVLIGRRLGARA